MAVKKRILEQLLEERRLETEKIKRPRSPPKVPYSPDREKKEIIDLLLEERRLENDKNKRSRSPPKVPHSPNKESNGNNLIEQLLEERRLEKENNRPRSPSKVPYSPDNESNGNSSSEPSSPASTRSLASSIKSQESSSSSRSSSKRNLRFQPWVEIQYTTSRKDMTDKERENYWLKDDFYLRSRQQTKMLVRYSLEFPDFRGKPLPSDHIEFCQEFFGDDIETRTKGKYLCLRGLESVSPTFVDNSRSCVINEQELQKLQGYPDETAIAQLYAEIATPCKNRARRRGLEDYIASAKTK